MNVVCGCESKYSFIDRTDIKKILGADLPSIIAINKKNQVITKKEKTFEDFKKCPPIKDLIVLKELGAG